MRIEPVSEAPELAEPAVANPFFYDSRKHAGVLQLLKMVTVGLVLFPLRFVLFVICFLGIWVTASIGHCCGAATSDDGKALPMRMPVSRFFLRLFNRGVLFALGYLWITVDGTNDATAPVVVCNHVSFVDPFIFAYLMLPMAVAKAEVRDAPFLGAIARATQTILVERESAESRHAVSAEISRRVQWRDAQPADVVEAQAEWPQLLIFPEATCTNTSCVIEFKMGPFAPMVPVQPACLQLGQDHLDVSWVGACNVPLTALRMMCQVYNRCQVTFLPVHRPAAEELTGEAPADPRPFAARVRAAMAAHLGVPLTNHNFLDTLLNRKVHLLRLPVAKFNLGMGSYPDGLDHAKKKLEEFAILDKHRTGALGPEEFAQLLGFDDESDAEANRRVTEAVIAQWDHDGDGRIDFREFLLFSAWRKVRREQSFRMDRQASDREPAMAETTDADAARLSEKDKADQELRFAFAMCFGAFDTDHDGRVTREQFVAGVRRVAPSIDEAGTLLPVFAAVDGDGDGVVTLEQFMAYAERHPYLICSLLNALERPGDGVSRESSVTFHDECGAASAIDVE